MRILTDKNIFRSSYFKNICPGYEQFFEPEKLFLRMTDEPVELKRRQDILRDLLKTPELFEDLRFISEAIMQFKSSFDDMPNHDCGDFRLNLEPFNDADGAISLLARFLKTTEYAEKFPWLKNFKAGVMTLSERHCVEKMITAWEQAFVPEEHMRACDFGFNLDDILWPTHYKLLAMREREYTKKNTPYKIEQIKMPLSNRMQATFKELDLNTTIVTRTEGIDQFQLNDNRFMARRENFIFSEEAMGNRSKVNSIMQNYDAEFGKIMDEEFYSKNYILKAVACQLLRDRSASDAPARIKYFVTSLIGELEPLVTEFVPYLCAAKVALYWREKGIPFCIPAFGKPGEIDIKGLFNPYIAENEGIEGTIENDIALSGEIAVVTGANRGGKTAFVTSVTLCQILFQLGFPIPAKSAKLGLFNGIITVFASEEQGLIGTGRLGEELKKLAAGLKAAQEGNTLICFNEPLTGTSSRDGERILAETLCILKESEAMGFVVTHLLGLAHALDFLNQVSGSAFVTLTAQTDGDKPLYKIIPAPVAETSHAKAVVSRFIS
ncbi:MAG TPA: hypothetical protein PK629_11285 [Oscillospiraceae bacterium]|nr:hypothetical protein [Oscillospiraceae bacterium]